MKTLALMLFVALVSASSFAVEVGALPAPEFADTEVATNVPIVVSFDAMSRMAFTLSLDASPSNCVEVAVGTDADGDGTLSALESAYAFGYDCGSWFVRDAALDAETREADGRAGRVERAFLLRRRQLDADWNLLRVVRRGSAAVGEAVLVEGRKPGYFLKLK